MSLRVLANPYIAYDHLGRLSGVVRYDPLQGRPGEIHYVDAKLITKVIERRSETTVIRGITFRQPLRDGVGRGAKFVVGDADLRDHTAEHLLEGDSVPHTDYFVQRIREGALIPLDEPTHRIAFGAGKSKLAFKAPTEVLAAKRQALIDRWKAEYPDDEVPEWPVHTFGTAEETPPPSPASPVTPPALPMLTPAAPPLSEVEEPSSTPAPSTPLIAAAAPPPQPVIPAAPAAPAQEGG